jgi:hypothetical protein
VVTVSSSDIEEALELLSLSPSCGMSPRPSGCDAQELSSSFDASSDLVEDRPEANDMATSVYVALTVEPLSYRAPMSSAPCSERKSRARSSSSQRCRSMSSRPSGCDAQELSSSFDASSDLVEDWPDTNDMAASVYVALTVEPSS